jgi:hypothetical protein
MRNNLAMRKIEEREDVGPCTGQTHFSYFPSWNSHIDFQKFFPSKRKNMHGF